MKLKETEMTPVRNPKHICQKGVKNTAVITVGASPDLVVLLSLSFLWTLELSHRTCCWTLPQLHPLKKRLCHQSSGMVYISRCGFFLGWWFNLPPSSVATLLPLALGILSLVIKLAWERHWNNHKLVVSELQKACDTNINVSQCRGRFISRPCSSLFWIFLVVIPPPIQKDWTEEKSVASIHPTSCPNLAFKTMQTNLNIY